MSILLVGLFRDRAAGQSNFEHRSGVVGAVRHANLALEPAQPTAHDVQPQSRARFFPLQFVSDTEKPAEDLASQPRGMPRPLSQTWITTVPAFPGRTITSTRGFGPAYLTALSRRLRKMRSKSKRRPWTVHGLEIPVHRVRWNAVAKTDHLRTIGQERAQRQLIHVAIDIAGIQPARIEHLIDQMVQSLDIFHHEAVEIGLFRLTPPAAVECLQIKLERCDGGFQLVGYAVDEVRLPAGEIDRLDRQAEVQRHPDNQEHNEHAADRQQHPVHGRVAVVGQVPKTFKSTQPTVSTTSSVNITTARVIGRPRGRRRCMVVSGGNVKKLEWESGAGPAFLVITIHYQEYSIIDVGSEPRFTSSV